MPPGSDTQILAFKVTVVDNSGGVTIQEFDMTVDNSATSTLPAEEPLATTPASTTSSSSGGGALNPLLLLFGWLLYFGLLMKKRQM